MFSPNSAEMKSTPPCQRQKLVRTWKHSSPLSAINTITTITRLFIDETVSISTNQQRRRPTTKDLFTSGYLIARNAQKVYFMVASML